MERETSHDISHSRIKTWVVLSGLEGAGLAGEPVAVGDLVGGVVGGPGCLLLRGRVRGVVGQRVGEEAREDLKVSGAQVGKMGAVGDGGAEGSHELSLFLFHRGVNRGREILAGDCG